ncbi:IclR family transcriptional regulator [Microbacterium sp.]|uniref:IclR family transcriptional regulator n=1 Tax=Microbacterium sp. TaxID=51671 RepID=UPI00092C4B93|nr:IclR family transcriptional regulator [Microbacterium sp.]MBN9193582.1 IclR family transcriptional regulator [Microbacterium sp.]OJU57963.1 MAG: transcriptional regulator [Microbacterium sp. 70-38]
MAEDAGMLARTMRVLGCFSEDEPAVTAAEIAARTGLPTSTVHRLLADLVGHGLLARAPGHRYVVGPRLWELGELSPLALRLRETALPHMARLYEATGENVHLAVLDGPAPEASDALFVGRVTGSGSIPTLSRMGGRQPLHTTGVGKALLSTRDAAWLERYFEVPLERETLHSVTDPEVLRAELARARARGYATTREEMTLGNVSVAAPVAPVQGLPPIAIGLVVHLERADERRLAPLVVQAARDLHADLRAAR